MQPRLIKIHETNSHDIHAFEVEHLLLADTELFHSIADNASQQTEELSKDLCLIKTIRIIKGKFNDASEGFVQQQKMN